MSKYRALVSFAGSILSMYSGEEKEIEDDVADEFVKIGYIINIDNLKSDSQNKEDKEDKEENKNLEENVEEQSETKKDKNKTKKK